MKMKTRNEAIDEIVAKYNSSAQITRKPRYDLPKGMKLPRIDVEVRTTRSIDLYVVADLSEQDASVPLPPITGEEDYNTLVKQLEMIREHAVWKGVYSLILARQQMRTKKKVNIFLECVNALPEHLDDTVRSVLGLEYRSLDETDPTPEAIAALEAQTPQYQ